MCGGHYQLRAVASNLGSFKLASQQKRGEKKEMEEELGLGLLDAMIHKSTKAGTVLRNVLHARMCTAAKGTCHVPNCYALKKLLRHCVQCRLNVNADGASECSISGCKTVRALLDHMLACHANTSVARAQGREGPPCIICTVANVEEYQQRLRSDSSASSASSHSSTTTNQSPDSYSSPAFSRRSEDRFRSSHSSPSEEEGEGDRLERIQSFRPSWFDMDECGDCVASGLVSTGGPETA